jgi:ribosomal protein L29
MKRKALNELKTKTLPELKKIVQEKNISSIKAKAEMKAGKEKNLKRSKFLRRDVAQILTIISEKSFSEKEGE